MLNREWMEINLELLDEAYHLSAKNEDGRTIELDGSIEIGGNNRAMRPMQAMLSALGGCASMDVLSILRKQKQEIIDYNVKISGERENNKVPSLFVNIHLHFVLKGDLDPAKVERAIDLSLQKYCSVAKILEKTAKITHSYTIKPK